MLIVGFSMHAVYPLEKTFFRLKIVPIAINFAVERLASLWRANDKEVMTLTIPEDCEGFKSYYDALQEMISQLSILDELLSGMYILHFNLLLHMPTSIIRDAK